MECIYMTNLSLKMTKINQKQTGKCATVWIAKYCKDLKMNSTMHLTIYILNRSQLL